MATIAMKMNEVGIEHDSLMTKEYGEEVMCAGWNPQLTLASESPVAQINRHIYLPADLASVDIDAFLKKMYEHQC